MYALADTWPHTPFNHPPAPSTAPIPSPNPPVLLQNVLCQAHPWVAGDEVHGSVGGGLHILLRHLQAERNKRDDDTPTLTRTGSALRVPSCRRPLAAVRRSAPSRTSWKSPRFERSQVSYTWYRHSMYGVGPLTPTRSPSRYSATVMLVRSVGRMSPGCSIASSTHRKPVLFTKSAVSVLPGQSSGVSQAASESGVATLTDMSGPSSGSERPRPAS